MGLAGGVNQYGYVGGDPVNFSDPFGLWGFPRWVRNVVAAVATWMASHGATAHPSPDGTPRPQIEQVQTDNPSEPDGPKTPAKQRQPGTPSASPKAGGPDGGSSGASRGATSAGRGLLGRILGTALGVVAGILINYSEAGCSTLDCRIDHQTGTPPDFESAPPSTP
ncbi:MAG: hypothetical protein KF709_12725 [Gemmatimonadaceae bacterium]|nr:hypothetical protein [Gemmatimonadaceae bacterium]